MAENLNIGDEVTFKCHHPENSRFRVVERVLEFPPTISRLQLTRLPARSPETELPSRATSLALTMKKGA